MFECGRAGVARRRRNGGNQSTVINIVADSSSPCERNARPTYALEFAKPSEAAKSPHPAAWVGRRPSCDGATGRANPGLRLALTECANPDGNSIQREVFRAACDLL